jgi:prepilin-type N-terminal cleavage/methylation domain-containing protein/prepilin-type processing-associated H-X9-DG protein
MAEQNRRQAMTLIELLVVLAIIAVLLGLLLSAVQRVRESANRLTCVNHLKQIGLANHHYHDSRGSLPVGCSYLDGKDPQPHMTWMTRLLPYLEQEALWKQALQAYEAEKFFEYPPHLEILGHVQDVYTCPSDPRTLQPALFHPGFSGLRVALTAYQGVEGRDQTTRDGLFYLDSHVRFADITDGTSNTLAVGERPPSPDMSMGWWYAGWGQSKDGSADSVLGVRELRKYTGGAYTNCSPGPFHYRAGTLWNACDAFHFWSMHPGGAHFLFADGSVHFLSYSADPLMPALATRNGGEAVTVPE